MGPTGLSHLSIVTHAKSLLCTSQLLLNQYLGDLSSSLIRVLSSAALRCLSPIPNGIVSSYYLCTSGHFNRTRVTCALSDLTVPTAPSKSHWPFLNGLCNG